MPAPKFENEEKKKELIVLIESGESWREICKRGFSFHQIRYMKACLGLLPAYRKGGYVFDGPKIERVRTSMFSTA
jgi:hypothetical protein